MRFPGISPTAASTIPLRCLSCLPVRCSSTPAGSVTRNITPRPVRDKMTALPSISTSDSFSPSNTSIGKVTRTAPASSAVTTSSTVTPLRSTVIVWTTHG